jgi:phosphatidylserine decarboxylase
MNVWLILVFLFCVLGFSLFIFLKFFHRIPNRKIPSYPKVIISPADGRIWQIIPFHGEKEVLIPKRFLGKIETWMEDIGKSGTIVSIFMNPLDAHVNWSPIHGKILSIRHVPGGFSFANTWKSLTNEKNEITIEGEGIRLKMIQIAGFLARRIECWAKEGGTVSRGALIGMIRLGSQVTLVLPETVEVLVKVGEKVKGGETILGRIKDG